MKSGMRGKNTSSVEVLNIGQNGAWLLVKNQEYFLDCKNFPWFQNASIKEIQDVKLIHEHHLYWKSLDIDLELESLVDIEKYPLKYVA